MGESTSVEFCSLTVDGNKLFANVLDVCLI